MDQNATRSLILAMLNSGKLLPETVEDLNEYLEELEQRPLDKMDTDYLQGLAGRLGFAAGGTAPPSHDGDRGDDEDEIADDWADDHDEADDGALDEAMAQIEAVQAQLATARAAVDKARGAFDEMKGSADSPTDALETALNEAADALAERG